MPRRKKGISVFTLGKIIDKEIVLLTCGVGKVAAAIGCVEMISAYNPDCIINSGIAGGVSDSVIQGDIVLSQQISYHDVWCGEGNVKGQIQDLPARFDADSAMIQKIEKVAEKSHKPIHIGLLCSGDQFITTKDEILNIRKNFPEALAVDMESGAIAHTCYLYKTPFICCRLISDTPALTDNHTKQYEKFWETAADKSFSFLNLMIGSL